jgi:hypothetical protein
VVAGVTAVADPAAAAAAAGDVALWQPIREWQALRRANGEDPHDWAAYRVHVQALGGPDPGAVIPGGFGD